MAGRSYRRRRRSRGLTVLCAGMAAGALAIMLTVSFVPAVGLVEREVYLLACGGGLFVAGWLLGTMQAEDG